MCKELFDNGNGDLVEAAIFVRDNVLDTDCDRDDTECPNCGNQASEYVFDECLGGAINQVSSLDCMHCGHHECSQEVCPTCEENLEASIQASADALERDMEDGGKLSFIAECIDEQMSEGRPVSGCTITLFKLIMTNNPGARAFCYLDDPDNDGMYRSCSVKEAINIFKMHLLNLK
ncbi:hypothetical protein, partial [Vibrio azureus]